MLDLQKLDMMRRTIEGGRNGLVMYRNSRRCFDVILHSNSDGVSNIGQIRGTKYY